MSRGGPRGQPYLRMLSHVMRWYSGVVENKCKGLSRCFKANLMCDGKYRYVLEINISLSIQLVLNNTRTRTKIIHQTI